MVRLDPHRTGIVHLLGQRYAYAGSIPNSGIQRSDLAWLKINTSSISCWFSAWSRSSVQIASSIAGWEGCVVGVAVLSLLCLLSILQHSACMQFIWQIELRPPMTCSLP
eukprot:1590728-Amphidinium_carterae.2